MGGGDSAQTYFHAWNCVRAALKLADAMAPCVLFANEIEKALAGVTSSGQTDSDVPPWLVVASLIQAMLTPGCGLPAVTNEARPLTSTPMAAAALRDYVRGCPGYVPKSIAMLA